MNRACEIGWELLVRDDPSGRRGLWLRENPNGVIELCSGREGDDWFVSLAPGDVLTEKLIRQLVDVLTGVKEPSIEY